MQYPTTENNFLNIAFFSQRSYLLTTENPVGDDQTCTECGKLKVQASVASVCPGMTEVVQAPYHVL